MIRRKRQYGAEYDAPEQVSQPGGDESFGFGQEMYGGPYAGQYVYGKYGLETGHQSHGAGIRGGQETYGRRIGYGALAEERQLPIYGGRGRDPQGLSPPVIGASGGAYPFLQGLVRPGVEHGLRAAADRQQAGQGFGGSDYPMGAYTGGALGGTPFGSLAIGGMQDAAVQSSWAAGEYGPRVQPPPGSFNNPAYGGTGEGAYTGQTPSGEQAVGGTDYSTGYGMAAGALTAYLINRYTDAPGGAAGIAGATVGGAVAGGTGTSAAAMGAAAGAGAGAIMGGAAGVIGYSASKIIAKHVFGSGKQSGRDIAASQFYRQYQGHGIKEEAQRRGFETKGEMLLEPYKWMTQEGKDYRAQIVSGERQAPEAWTEERRQEVYERSLAARPDVYRGHSTKSPESAARQHARRQESREIQAHQSMMAPAYRPSAWQAWVGGMADIGVEGTQIMDATAGYMSEDAQRQLGKNRAAIGKGEDYWLSEESDPTGKLGSQGRADRWADIESQESTVPWRDKGFVEAYEQEYGHMQKWEDRFKGKVEPYLEKRERKGRARIEASKEHYQGYRTYGGAPRGMAIPGHDKAYANTGIVAAPETRNLWGVRDDRDPYVKREYKDKEPVNPRKAAMDKELQAWARGLGRGFGSGGRRGMTVSGAGQQKLQDILSKYEDVYSGRKTAAQAKVGTRQEVGGIAAPEDEVGLFGTRRKKREGERGMFEYDVGMGAVRSSPYEGGMGIQPQWGTKGWQGGIAGGADWSSYDYSGPAPGEPLYGEPQPKAITGTEYDEPWIGSAGVPM